MAATNRFAQAPVKQEGGSLFKVARKGLLPEQIFAEGLADGIVKGLQEAKKEDGQLELKWQGMKARIGRDGRTGVLYAALRRSDSEMPQTLVFAFDRKFRLLGVSDGLGGGTIAYDDTQRGRIAELVAFFLPCFNALAPREMGLGRGELEEGRRVALENEKLYKRFARDNAGDLGMLEKFGKTSKQDFHVRQGEAAMLGPSAAHESLYATGAGNCILISAVFKDKFAGGVKRVALGHFDFMAEKKDFEDFFALVRKGEPGEFEIYLLSGSGFKTLRAYEAAGEFGRIAFMNADLDGSRIDAVRVTKEGKVS